jgi:hypothetical protein
MIRERNKTGNVVRYAPFKDNAVSERFVYALAGPTKIGS